MEYENRVRVKSKLYAIRIVKMYRYLAKEQHEFVMSKQVLRSGTSIGANIAEAECGFSRRDFAAKLYIAFKECAEIKYWLELLYETEYISEEMFESIMQDCDEIYRILSATTKTLRETM